MKLDRLMDDLKKDQLFGQVDAGMLNLKTFYRAVFTNYILTFI
jgi:hypothetical protein